MNTTQKVYANINGVKQGMFVDSTNATNPVLLVVHGGPGMPDYFLTERYPIGLQEYCTVVWWEQRGACLSYHAGIPHATMTVEQFISDTLAVTDYLRSRFGQEKIYLLGHSWGSFIGIQAAARAPALYHAYIGMAQMAYQLESERLAHAYMLQQFQSCGDRRMVRKLEAAPVTLQDGTPPAYLALRDEGMHKLGIGTTHDMRSVVTGIFVASWLSRCYTLREKLSLWRGRAFSRSFGFWEQVIHTDLRELAPVLDLPVYFLHGIHDYTCSYALARAYWGQLQSPAKGFYTFARSAHSPILEEPQRARTIFEHDILAGRNCLAD